MVSLERIRSAIAEYTPGQQNVSSGARQAAVATILRQTGHHTEALFILRATRAGDPWSGHMAFPGGHREEQDDNLQETAERETMEEIGLDLRRYATCLGEVDAVRPNAGSGRGGLIVVPFVYELHEPDADLDLNDEVDAVLWGSLNDMHRGHSYRKEKFMIQGRREPFPAYGVEGQFVWGLTYRMLDTLFQLADPDWTPHDQ